jgi:flavin reductase (DIM6/NTAB) family NADH-FMN oxidoreductase RutF
MTVTAESYRSALRRHPAGVAIITLMAESGPVGFTATSLASLSLDPPLLCFNITHTGSPEVPSIGSVNPHRGPSSTPASRCSPGRRHG